MNTHEFPRSFDKAFPLCRRTRLRRAPRLLILIILAVGGFCGFFTRSSASSLAQAQPPAGASAAASQAEATPSATPTPNTTTTTPPQQETSETAPPAPTTTTATSSSGKVKLEIVPGSIELPPQQEAATALLVLRNTGTGTLKAVKITPLTDAKVKVEGEPALTEPRDIVPQGEFSWTIKVSNQGTEPVSGNVTLRIDYQLAQTAAQEVPQVLHTTLQVKTRNVDELAEVKVETTLQSLDRQHPGRIYLVVKNKSNQSITVRDVKWDTPAFVEIDRKKFEDYRQANASDFVFPPHQTGVIPLEVGTAGRVQPGSHLLVFTVLLEWGENKSGQARNIVVTKSVDVGVLGESTILRILAVPSFLLIPGFLAVMTWGLLWKLGILKRKNDPDQFPLEFSEQPTKPQFWVVAITISIIIVALYMLFYSNFLVTYGLWDLVLVWLISFFVFGIGVYLAFTLLRRRYLNNRTPAQSDRPMDILKKLDRQGLGVYRDRVIVKTKVGGVEQIRTGFLLQDWNKDRETTWIGPAVQVQWTPQPPAQLEKKIQDSKDKVDGQRMAGGDAGKAIDGLKEANGYVVVSWKPAPNANEVSGLYEAKTAEIEPDGLDSIIYKI